MRVITGVARGRRLATIEGTDIVRPTTEKVKEAIFSAIQFEICGRRVLDLFAGSGQLGIEALSRGAKSAAFVDSSKVSIDTVKKNLETTKLLGLAKTVNLDYSSYLLRCTEVFDIAFLDPPYKSGILVDALEKTVEHLSAFGTAICEHPSDISLPDTVSVFKVHRVYKFGTICVTIYKKDEGFNE